jgi:hypothetical protein
MMAQESLNPAGEPCDLETCTQGSGEGSWKSAIHSNSLAPYPIGPLSPISTYVSRISFWWHIKGVARREERPKAT